MNPMVLAALPSLFQTITGSIQAIEGQQTLNSLQRPEYEIPSEVRTSLTLAQQEYGAVGRDEMNARIQNQLGAANSASVAVASGNGYAAAPAIEAQRQTGSREISALAEQKRRADLQRLMASQENMANYKDQEFQVNKFAPYAQRYNEGREQIGGGLENINTGLSGVSSLAQIYMSGVGERGLSPTQAASATSPSVDGKSELEQLISNKVRDNYGLMQAYNAIYQNQNRPR